MYLAGVSVRRVEDVTEALWGTRVSPAMVSNLNKKIYATIEAWRTKRSLGSRRVAMQRRPVSVRHAGNKLTPTQLLAIIVL
jgi:transposase-like protein